MERKEKPLKKLCQNPVKHARRMTQYNFGTRLEPKLFSGHFDKAGTVAANIYICTQFMRENDARG